MAVNSYLVHGRPDWWSSTDSSPCPTPARCGVRSTNRPTRRRRSLVTHPHPDHYAGAARLLAGLDVPIVATAAVDAVIRRDDAEKDADRRADDG